MTVLRVTPAGVFRRPASGPTLEFHPVSPTQPVRFGAVRDTLAVTKAPRVFVVSDAWPEIGGVRQINGVVTTVGQLTRHLEGLGVPFAVAHPDQFGTWDPNRLVEVYRDLKLANPLFLQRRLGRKIEAFKPDIVDIVVEGPLGRAAKAWCEKNGIPYVTNFATRHDVYAQKIARDILRRASVPKALQDRLAQRVETGAGRMLRKFHQGSRAVLVTNEAMRGLLARQGYGQVEVTGRGVDPDLFTPKTPAEKAAILAREGLAHLGGKGPIYVYMGRVAADKNLEAFLGLDVPGPKLIIGPLGHKSLLATIDAYRKRDQARGQDIAYAGERTGQALGDLLACGDVFVFPSKADTFGLVMLEALAAGLPVLAFNEPGPQALQQEGFRQVYIASDDADFGRQARRIGDALNSGAITPQACRNEVLGSRFLWEHVVAERVALYQRLLAQGDRKVG